MTIANKRLEDISVYNYIKYEVLGLQFVEQLQNQPLTFNNTNGLYMPSYEGLEPSPVGIGRGWVPFDVVGGSVDTSQEQVSRVSVVGPTTFSVNYILGGIKNPDVTPTAVSYYWNYVSVIDGWPGLTPPTSPSVAVDMSGSVRSGFQLGSGYISSRDLSLHIFATSNAERDDIEDGLFGALYNKSISVINYSQGDYIDFDGLFNTGFTATQNLKPSKIYFDNVVSRTVNVKLDWSDLNQYRSVVSCNVVSFVE